MIVCLCSAVPKTQLEAAIREGASSLDDLERCSGAGTGCGVCRDALKGMLSETRGSVTGVGPKKGSPGSGTSPRT